MKRKSRWSRIIGELGLWGFFVLFFFWRLFSNKKSFANSKNKMLS